MIVCCGVCGRQPKPTDDVPEILPIVHVASGLQYFRCRTHLSMGIKAGEGEKFYARIQKLKLNDAIFEAINKHREEVTQT